MIAGHTWVLLATQVRRASDKGSHFYRIHRPNNVTNTDMQEESLLQVRSTLAAEAASVFALHAAVH